MSLFGGLLYTTQEGIKLKNYSLNEVEKGSWLKINQKNTLLSRNSETVIFTVAYENISPTKLIFFRRREMVLQS